MRRFAGVGWIAALLLFLALAPARAQSAQEITLFSQTNYRGQSYTLGSAREALSVRWQVRSVRLGHGAGSWQLCSRPRYMTPCVTVTRSTASVNYTVASARPTQPPAPPPPPPPAQAASLRGMNAEFFPQPTDRSGRVISCSAGTAACAAQSATAFCRTHGWNRAAYSQQQTLNRRNYLADVLCTR